MKSNQTPEAENGSVMRQALGWAGLENAAFYATRPEGYGDLSSSILETVYGALIVLAGPGAARNYVQMVAGLTFVTEHLTGKTFIDSAYNLEKANWCYAPEILSEYHLSARAMVEEVSPKYDPKAPLCPSPLMREQMVGDFLINHESEIDNPEQCAKLRETWNWRRRQCRAEIR